MKKDLCSMSAAEALAFDEEIFCEPGRTRKETLDGDHGGLEFPKSEYEQTLDAQLNPALVTEGNTSDLGEKWGQYSDVETREVVDPMVAAIRASAGDEGKPFVAPRGVRPSVAVERELADRAIAMINASVGHSDKTRYTLVVFNMDNVSAETTAADIADYSLVSTIENSALIRIAQNELLRQFEAARTANELEI